MYSSLLNSIDKYSHCILRKFRLLATDDDFVLLASREYYNCCYVSIYRTSKNCFRVMVYFSSSDVCSFYNTYHSVKDLSAYLDILSSMLFCKYI